jgi:sugar phosphate isomerase/epimerase
MYVSLNGSLYGAKAAWPEVVELARKTGFGGVDINLSAAMKLGLDASRALFTPAGPRPGFCGLPFNATRDDTAFQTGLQGLSDAAQFAAAMGCPRMMTVIPASSETPKAEFREILKDRFTAIGEVLARHKVRLGLEFLGPLHFRTAQPHEFIWRMNELLAFARECHPNIGLVLDAWHWHHAGATATDIVRAGKEHIVVVHVSDAAAIPPRDVRDNQRLLPGEGVIDLTGFFQALQQTGYADSVSPEPLGRIPAEMSAEEGARLGLTSTLAVMRKAGIAV